MSYREDLLSGKVPTAIDKEDLVIELKKLKILTLKSGGYTGNLTSLQKLNTVT